LCLFAKEVNPKKFQRFESSIFRQLNKIMQVENEYMTFVEVVNDVLARLHEKDRKLLETLTIDEVLQTQYEFKLHIDRFYGLSNPDNPIYDSSKDQAEKVIRIVYGLIHHKEEI
jgi:flagellar biosynthesis/type III secretory pathway chaperone